MRQDFKKGGSAAWTRKEGKSESGGLNSRRDSVCLQNRQRRSTKV